MKTCRPRSNVEPVLATTQQVVIMMVTPGSTDREQYQYRCARTSVDAEQRHCCQDAACQFSWHCN